TVQPGQHEQDSNRSTHGYHTQELVRNGTQNRVVRREVPHRRDVIWSLERVRRLEVGLLQEVTAHFREEEHDGAEDEQEHYYANDVLDGVVRVERNAIQRHARFILVLLDINAQRVVRTHFMQRQDMQNHQTENHDRQSNHVQCKEAVQRNAGDQVVTTDPLGQVVADDRDGTEQRNDHLGTPVGHLSPWQQVTHEGFSHQSQIDHHAEDPHQLARLLIRAVENAAEHVQVNHDEERRSTRGVQIAQNPAVLHITHDVFNRGEGAFCRRLE